MDTSLATRLCHSITLAGIGFCQGPVDCLKWLKTRKMLKFMGKQDCLAVVAAAQAAEQAGLERQTLATATGLYLVSSHIPFEEDDMLPLARHSVDADGKFSMELFSSVGLDQVNPLLTFRCLPNMPIFHVSYNLGIQGPSSTGFPGLGQFYQVLEEALWALQEGEIEVAMVGAVADQNNFLVDYHWGRLPAAVPGASNPRPDAAGFLVLRKEGPGLARLRSLGLEYGEEAGPPNPWGPVELVHLLAQGGRRHHTVTHDGYRVASEWEPV